MIYKLLIIGFSLILFTSCKTEGPKKLNWIKIDNSERNTVCVVLNEELEDSISFENYKQKSLDRGRILVYAELRNRTNTSFSVDISTVFRDSDTIIVDESAWRNVAFTPNQTIRYKISSVLSAETFTIRIKNKK